MKTKIPCPLRTAADANPDSPAVVDQNRSLTFGELDAEVEAIVARLRNMNIGSGDVVAVLGWNSIEYVILLFAAFRLSFILMPLNCRLTADDWREQIDQADARLIVLGDGFEHETDFSTDTVLMSELNKTDSPYDRPTSTNEYRLDREALIIFSSGSTGRPRGIVLTWGNLYYSALGTASVLPLQQGDCWLAVLPFFHVGGILIPFRTMLAGSMTHICRRFDSAYIQRLIDAHAVNFLSVVPTMLAELMDIDEKNGLAGLEAIILGGAAVGDLLRREIIARRLPVLTTYGLTETASMVTLLPPGDDAKRLNTAGKVLPHREIKIENGRVLVRGEVLFSRYLDQAENERTSRDEFFATGDSGAIDDDGYLTIFGRGDEVIISGGENINLGRVEAALNSFDGVKSVVVLSRPDKKWGRRPIAFVEVSRPDLTEAAVLTLLREKLAAVMIPDRVIIVGEMPLTGSGKYDLPALRRQFAELFQESV